MKKFKKALIIFGSLFLLMFVFRLIYGYHEYPGGIYAPALTGNALPADFDFSRKNYASSKLQFKDQATLKTYNVDQKYEKIASLSAASNHFGEDEKLLRNTVKSFNALIQYEEVSGLPGDRLLQMAVGVQPEKFDRFVKTVKNIASLKTIEIHKYDKTNEYKDLMAKKASLEAIRNSLIALKNRGGKIEEYITLENRILELEDQLQGLGVRLGEFDAENEFCTVKYVLTEHSLNRKISFFQRIKVALEWTIKYYLLMAAILLCISLLTLVFLALLEKLRVFTVLFNKNDGPSGKPSV